MLLKIWVIVFELNSDITLKINKNIKMKQCKVCHQEFTGRSDKVFCSVKCKNIYHVRLKKNTDKAVRKINQILHRNRRILYELMSEMTAQKTIDRLILDKKGFNFIYHTHQQINSKGKTYYYVYDYGWMSFSDDRIMIVKRKFN